MKIWDKIRGPVVRMKEKRMAKRKEKLLIKAEDEELIVKSLPAEEDNSRIDIQKIVQNMEDPENMAEVVVNNLEEIIEQDNVKNTLKHLPDETVVEIVEENVDELQEQEKLEFAIRAIKDNDKKLKMANKNLTNLTDLELAQIFEELNPPSSQERKEKIEAEKIRIISKKIMQHMIEFGSAWHLAELTDSISNASKVKVLDSCLTVMKDYQENGKRKMDSSAKTNLVVDLLALTAFEYDRKTEVIEQYVNKRMLTQEEERTIKNDIEKQRIRQEKKEAQRKLGMMRD